jgi:hypothetical protein
MMLLFHGLVHFGGEGEITTAGMNRSLWIANHHEKYKKATPAISRWHGRRRVSTVRTLHRPHRHGYGDQKWNVRE